MQLLLKYTSLLFFFLLTIAGRTQEKKSNVKTGNITQRLRVIEIKGKTLYKGSPLPDVEISYDIGKPPPTVERHRKHSKSSNTGDYNLQIGVGYCAIISFHKKGYEERRLNISYPVAAVDTVRRSFVFEFDLEMVLEGEKDTMMPWGLIWWSKEENTFKSTWGGSGIKVVSDKQIVLKNILFENGKSKLFLPVLAVDEMTKLLEYLNKNKNTAIEISGYTDNTGTEEKNKKLSEARAKAVADYLVLKGIDKSRIKYKGYGSTNPVATNDTEEGRQENRRVEFIIKDLSKK